MIFVNNIDAGCVRHIVGNPQLITMCYTKSEPTTYGELDRYPLGIDIKIRMISYWAKFSDGKHSKLPNILYKLCLALSNIEGKNFIWLSSVKGILNECGLAYIWNTQTFQNTE